MIIENGYIQYAIKGEGTMTDDGFLTDAALSWAQPVPCQWSLASANNLARILGEPYKEVSYTVLVEDTTFPVNTQQVRLYDSNGTAMGEFSVIHIEQLDAVGQLRISV